MSDRIRQELQLLGSRYPLVTHGSGLDWVCVSGLPLPAGRFVQDSTDVLWLLPPGYPLTPPDDFFVRGDLSLQTGAAIPAFNRGPNSSSGIAPIAGDWGWFSWHASTWRPAPVVAQGDNLVTYLRSIKACLRGEEP